MVGGVGSTVSQAASFTAATIEVETAAVLEPCYADIIIDCVHRSHYNFCTACNKSFTYLSPSSSWNSGMHPSYGSTIGKSRFLASLCLFNVRILASTARM